MLHTLRTPLALLVTLAALSGCGSSASPPPAKPIPAPKAAAAPPPSQGAGGCTKVSAPSPKQAETKTPKPKLKLDAAKTYTVGVSTNCGAFTIRLDPKNSPKTSASFAYLTKRRFFDGLSVLRVARAPEGGPFVIQAGDPLNDGTGGPGYTVVEPPKRGATFPLGTVAMAKTGQDPAGASGSQFFVVTGPDATPALQGMYAIAGKVTKGLDVVKRLGDLKTNPPSDGMPLEPVVIAKATLTQG